MAAVGRILQAIGWIWVAASFFGGVVNLPFDLNFFPGLILVFVSRILRTQAARNAPPEPEQILQRAPRPTAPRAETRPPAQTEQPTKPPPEPHPEPERTESRDSEAEAKRREMLEQILITGTGLAEETARPPSEVEAAAEEEDDSRGTTGPMSSAEMIAQARKRWNKS